MLRPGFGPGSPTREAGILDRTILPELERWFSLRNKYIVYSANQNWKLMHISRLPLRGANGFCGVLDLGDVRSLRDM